MSDDRRIPWARVNTAEEARELADEAPLAIIEIATPGGTEFELWGGHYQVVCVQLQGHELFVYAEPLEDNDV